MADPQPSSPSMLSKACFDARLLRFSGGAKGGPGLGGTCNKGFFQKPELWNPKKESSVPPCVGLCLPPGCPGMVGMAIT